MKTAELPEIESETAEERDARAKGEGVAKIDAMIDDLAHLLHRMYVMFPADGYVSRSETKAERQWNRDVFEYATEELYRRFGGKVPALSPIADGNESVVIGLATALFGPQYWGAGNDGAAMSRAHAHAETGFMVAQTIARLGSQINGRYWQGQAVAAFFQAAAIATIQLSRQPTK